MPPLDAQQQQQVARVQSALAARLARSGGWLSFAEYMQFALYEPGLGYYSAGATKFGAAGDFTTAPELSTLFGHCVARQVAELLGEGGEVLEFGAGTGALAASVLGELAARDRLPERYSIVEVSADLAQRQQQRLAQLPPALAARVRWLQRLPDTPVEGVVLANEVADALACERFVVGANGLLQQGVVQQAEGSLAFQARPAPPALQAEFDRLQPELAAPLPVGYCSELCLQLDPWVAALGSALRRGAVLLFDYGLPRREYYHPQRRQGTLRCHFRHRAHEDALWLPGLQDLTAWVDFTRIAEAATAAGLEVAGYCTQSAFLLATGIEAELAAAGEGALRARLASEARQLLLPGEMGETFKVMALTRGWDAPLAGCSLQDLRRQL